MKLAFQIIGFPFRLAIVLFIACVGFVPWVIILSLEPEWVDDMDWKSVGLFIIRGVERS